MIREGDTVQIGGERWEVIHAYSRAQAILDGALVNVSRSARRVGFRYPLAVTRAVWAEMAKPSPFCRRSGRRRAFLRCFRALLHGAAWRASLPFQPVTDRVRFTAQSPSGARLFLWLVCGPGDEAEPVLTIQLEGED